MFKNCHAYPHGPAKQKIIEKFLRTLHVFVLHAYPHGPAGQKKMNLKKDYETIFNCTDALMSYKSCSVNLQHEDVIHNSYLTTLHKLHLALVAHDVYG